MPPLKKKPETSHPCVDHHSKSIHKYLQTVKAGFRRHEADQSESLTGSRPSPPVTPEPKPAASKEREDSDVAVKRLETVFKQYSNSVGLGLTVLVRRARTHTLEGKQPGGRVLPETVT